MSRKYQVLLRLLLIKFTPDAITFVPLNGRHAAIMGHLQTLAANYV